MESGVGLEPGVGCEVVLFSLFCIQGLCWAWYNRINCNGNTIVVLATAFPLEIKCKNV